MEVIGGPRGVLLHDGRDGDGEVTLVVSLVGGLLLDVFRRVAT